MQQRFTNSSEKKQEKKPHKNYSEGFVALYATILVVLFFSVGLSMSLIALRGMRFASFTENSQYAYYAAESGLECALYWDAQSSVFESGGEIDCGAVADISVGGAPSFDFNFSIGSDGLVEVSVDKSMVTGETDITVLGYDTDNPSNPRRVERGLFARYTEIVGAVNACNYDVGLTLDRSSSLDDQELQDLKDAAKSIIKNFESEDHITEGDGVTDDESLFAGVKFSNASTLMFPLTDAVSIMNQKIDEVDQQNWTNTASGVVRARLALEGGHSDEDRSNNEDFLVIISDGVPLQCTMGINDPTKDFWCNGGDPGSDDLEIDPYTNPLENLKRQTDLAKVPA